MLRRVSLLCLALMAAASARAEAPAPNAPMTQAALQAELYGIRMSGTESGSGQAWSECIEPGGNTVYLIGDTRAEGVLEITADGAACFTYPGTGASCFRVQRAPKGYLFHGYGLTYYASKIERGVKSCKRSELVS